MATNVNPCQLVTQAEASKLAGVHLGTGKVEASGTGKRCTYGAQTTNVFTVEVAQASDATTAQSTWDAEQARAQDALKQLAPSGVHVSLHTSTVSGLGDRAASASASAKIQGVTISVSGIYVLKGATFFAFQDLALNKSAPSEADLKSQAEKVLTRI